MKEGTRICEEGEERGVSVRRFLNSSLRMQQHSSRRADFRVIPEKFRHEIVVFDLLHSLLWKFPGLEKQS